MIESKVSENPRKAFLSYAAADRDAANAIRDQLTRRGIQVWMDDDIEPGDSIAATIQRAINDADDVLILLSPASTQSTWTSFETAAALATQGVDASRKRIIPVLLEKDVQLPPTLDRFSVLDLSEPASWSIGMDRLAKAIQHTEPLSLEKEATLERQNLNAQRQALEIARDASRYRIERLEQVIRLTLLAVSFIVAIAALLISIVGDIGGIPVALSAGLLGALSSAVLSRKASQ